MSELLQHGPAIGHAIVWFIAIGFGAWLALLLVATIRAFAWTKQIRLCRDVAPLSKAILGHLELQTLELEPEIAEGAALTNEDDEPTEAFSVFCEDRQLKRGGIVTDHLWGMYIAGWNSYSFDPHVSIHRSRERMDRLPNALAGFASLFIIVGLLGTLFGLGDTLLGLSNAIHLNGSQTGDFRQALQSRMEVVFEGLKGAFLPSMTGVLAAIGATLLLTIYRMTKGSPTGTLLSEYTQECWEPGLVPNKTTALTHRAERVYKAAARVAENAEGIEQELTALRDRISDSQGPLEALVVSATELREFTKSFIDSTNSLLKSQGESQRVVVQLGHGVTELNGLVRAYSEQNTQFLENTAGRLQDVMAKTEEALECIRSQEVASQSRSEALIKPMQAFVDAALVRASKEQKEHDDLLRVVESEIRKSTLEMTQTLSASLNSVATRLGGMETPLKDTADRMELSLNAIDRRNEEMFKVFRETTTAHNAVLEKAVRELDNLRAEINSLPDRWERTLHSRNERRIAAEGESASGRRIWWSLWLIKRKAA